MDEGMKDVYILAASEYKWASIDWSMHEAYSIQIGWYKIRAEDPVARDEAGTFVFSPYKIRVFLEDRGVKVHHWYGPIVVTYYDVLLKITTSN